MSKPVKRNNAQALSSRSKQPSKVAVLAELIRVAEEAGAMNVSRDYLRANSTIGDGWNRYWCSFKDFLAAGMADDDLYYEALVELVDSVAPPESTRKI
jgi:hypothetical protein